MKKLVMCAGALLVVLAACAKDVEVMCVYYPHWHRYPKGDEWFGADKWKEGEWTFVKDTRPRFPGHKQPLVPYTGYLDESNPQDMEKDIALAANAGIDVFLYDYYYYNGQITQEEALEQGFLKARNRDRMKFALMWCYHERRDQFRPKLGEPRRMLMELAHTPEEFYGLIDLCIARYFRHPLYWRKNGGLFLSVFGTPYLIEKHGGVEKVKEMLAEGRRRVRAAGLGELHLNAQGLRPHQAVQAEQCGFDSLTTYGTGTYLCRGSMVKNADGKWELNPNRHEYDYAELREPLPKFWRDMDAATKLPYFPIVATGSDCAPRCRLNEPYPWRKLEYPYIAAFTNNTPDIFRDYLAEAKKFAESSPKNPGVVYINGWNEYTEGTDLVPNNFDSDGFLRAVASVFGRRPAGEYTFVDPVSRMLFTAPAATFENVAYGGHPKQKIDVYLPKGRKGPFPVVMYIHGGGWSGGAMEDRIVGTAIAGLLEKGVAVVCTGYRYIRDAQADGVKPPVVGCLDDCEKALGFVKAHAGEWNIDMSRLGLAGGSAGACTALYLSLKDDCSSGVKAVAPIIAQTSMDPAEMRAWIPNSRYGAHAFGYARFDDWLAHRDECLADIERISPAALLRKATPAKVPRMRLFYNRALKPGEQAKDPTHSPVFGERFAEIARKRGIQCEIAYGGRIYYGDAFTWLADVL